MKEYKFLIGDDAFEAPGIARSAIANMLLAMWDASGKQRPGPVRLNQEADTYVCDVTSLDAPIRVETAKTVVETIAKASEQYDWVVTDLRYGDAEPMGGVRVINAIKHLKNPVKAVCTSNDPKTLEGIADSGADYVVTASTNKFSALGKVIMEHYIRRLV